METPTLDLPADLADALQRAAVADMERRASVAEARAELLESERDRLATALERSQESERLALAALREEQSRSAVLLASGNLKRIEQASDTPADAGEQETVKGPGWRERLAEWWKR